MNKFILSLLLCVSLNAFAAELYELVRSGTIDQVREYLDRHPESVDYHENEYRNTPLFTPYDVEIARLLIDRGADVNHENRYKQTPLFFPHNVEIAQLLIDRGADVNHENLFKQTPLFEAPNVEVARLLIDCGARVNHESEKKETPLLCAAALGHVEVAQLLIDHGANVNQVDHHGITPLFEAATNLHLECVRLLLQSGANIPFTVDQSEAVRIRNVAEIIQLLEAKNILTASREVVDVVDHALIKVKTCLRQTKPTCIVHALKNAELLTEYYQVDSAKRQEIDRKFVSHSVYVNFFKSSICTLLKKFIAGKNFTINGITKAVLNIPGAINPKIQVVSDPTNFSLPQRDQSRKSEIVLVMMSNTVHWYAIGLEEQSDGAVQILVLDSLYNHFRLEKLIRDEANFYRKLTHWFKGGNTEQPAAKQLRSRL